MRERFVFLGELSAAHLPEPLRAAAREDLLHSLKHPLLRASASLWKVSEREPQNLSHTHFHGESTLIGWPELPAESDICFVAADAPHIPLAFLQEAFGRLAFGAEAVFGPAENGGVYLIGFRSGAWTTFVERAPELARQISVGSIGDSLKPDDLRVVQSQPLPPWYRIKIPSDLSRLRRDLRRGVVHPTHFPVTEAWATSYQGEDTWS